MFREAMKLENQHDKPKEQEPTNNGSKQVWQCNTSSGFGNLGYNVTEVDTSYFGNFVDNVNEGRHRCGKFATTVASVVVIVTTRPQYVFMII